MLSLSPTRPNNSLWCLLHNKAHSHNCKGFRVVFVSVCMHLLRLLFPSSSNILIYFIWFIYIYNLYIIYIYLFANRVPIGTPNSWVNPHFSIFSYSMDPIGLFDGPHPFSGPPPAFCWRESQVPVPVAQVLELGQTSKTCEELETSEFTDVGKPWKARIHWRSLAIKHVGLTWVDHCSWDFNGFHGTSCNIHGKTSWHVSIVI